MNDKSEHVMLDEKAVASRFEYEALAKRLWGIVVGLKLYKKNHFQIKFFKNSFKKVHMTKSEH